MKEKDFDELELVTDSISELLKRKFEQGEFKEITTQLETLSRKLGEDRYLSFDFQIHLLDPNKENPLRVMSLAIGTSPDKEAFWGWGDSTPCRYVLEGKILKVPHDLCPGCWGEWGFKFQNHQCGSCGIELGKDVKVLLDTEVCPSCEKGKVTPQERTCDLCGFEVKPEFAYWG